MKKVGRPEKVDEYVLSLLESAFKWGCSDEEACYSAGISPATLYRYQKENPQFREQKEGLKQWPVLVARKTVVENMEKDPALALKYLQLKKKDEFSPRAEITTSGPITFSWIESEESMGETSVFESHKE